MPGNAVCKGQTLAILDNQEFIDIQQNYLEAKNKFELAKAEYNRQSESYKSDISSQKNVHRLLLITKASKFRQKRWNKSCRLLELIPLS